MSFVLRKNMVLTSKDGIDFDEEEIRQLTEKVCDT